MESIKMSYDEFEATVTEIAKRLDCYNFNGYDDQENSDTLSRVLIQEEVKEKARSNFGDEFKNSLPIKFTEDYRNTMSYDLALVKIVETGGAQGGNCWGDDAEHYELYNGTPTSFVLKTVLKELAPKITFLEYGDLEALTEKGYYTDSEYYGNYTDYQYEVLKLSTIYDFLVEKGYIA